MTRSLPFALALLFLAPAAAAPRDPGGQFQVTPRNGYQPSVAMSSAGEFVVAWAQAYQEEPGLDGIAGRIFGPDGAPRSGEFQIGRKVSEYQGPISTAADRDGFTVAWGQSDQSAGPSAFLRRFDRTGSARTGEIALGRRFFPNVASDARGRSVLVAGEENLFAWRYDTAGRPLGKRVLVTPGEIVARVSADAAGNFVVVWAGDAGIRGRLFDTSARPRGASFQIAPNGSSAYLAGDGTGRFVVAWQRPSGGIFVGLYAPSGRAVTGPVAVTGALPAPLNFLSVAMDARGQVLVVWSLFQATPTLEGRFFNASGVPAGPEFTVSAQANALSPSAAGGPAGRFVVVWDQRLGGEPSTIVGRNLLWARAGDVPCLARGGAFRCDLDRDGSADAAFNFGGAVGPRRLGDLDGDGRDDACVVRGGLLLCDTAHDGGAAEVRIDISGFGEAGEELLLGDLDGEGRDDACVFRGGRLLCDTAHDGGTAEVIVAFPGAVGIPLLGDLDGDGDDDPCFASDRLRCDSAHDGGVVPEISIPFDLEPGDVPLLGDVDGDGDDDPCVFRDGRFLCDTVHGGRFDTVLSVGSNAEGIPLLGNLQGT